MTLLSWRAQPPKRPKATSTQPHFLPHCPSQSLEPAGNQASCWAWPWAPPVPTGGSRPLWIQSQGPRVNRSREKLRLEHWEGRGPSTRGSGAEVGVEFSDKRRNGAGFREPAGACRTPKASGLPEWGLGCWAKKGESAQGLGRLHS